MYKFVLEKIMKGYIPAHFLDESLYMCLSSSWDSSLSARQITYYLNSNTVKFVSQIKYLPKSSPVLKTNIPNSQEHVKF